MKELKILHLYSDLLDLYGDYYPMLTRWRRGCGAAGL